MRARFRWIALAAVAVSLGAGVVAVPHALQAAPVTRHVTSCASSGAGSLPDIVGTVAQSGDTVVFDRDCTISLSATLAIPANKDLTIDALNPTPRAIVLDGGGSVQLIRLQATNNHGPTVTLNGLTLRNGRATGQGGAIFNDQGTLTITNAAIVNNAAVGGGGGIENAGGTLRITNSTLFNNSVTGATVATGGAIENNAFGKVTVTSSTVSGNHVSSSAAQSSAGGGIFDYAQAANSLTLAGSVVAGNTGGNCGGTEIGSANPTVASGGRNVIGVSAAGACGQDFSLSGGSGDKVGTSGAPLDAKLGDLGNYGGKTPTLPLLPGSPAFDTGACPSGVTTDQRGIARPQGASCDSGAFESQGVQSITVAVAAGGPATLKVGQSAHYVATGTYDGGGTADVSATATWSSDNAAIVVVDATGKATGQSPGSTGIVAKVGTVPGLFTVTVTSPNPIGIAPVPVGRPASGATTVPTGTVPAALPPGRPGGPTVPPGPTGLGTPTAIPPPAAPAPPSR